VRLHLLDEGGHLPVGEAGHGLAECTSHPEDGLLVEDPAVERRRDDGDGLHVGLAVRGVVARVGKSQSAPQPRAAIEAEAAL
jgi:hypothetical protein